MEIKAGRFMGMEMKAKGFANLTPSAMREQLKAGWSRVAFYWHEHYREKHFSQEGAREYNYSPRAGEPGNERKKFWSSYTGRKIRKWGHRRPLEWSGESHHRAREVRFDATSNGVTIRLNTPVFNFRGPNSKIDMRAEMTAVTEQELNETATFLDKQIAEEMDKHAAEGGNH